MSARSRQPMHVSPTARAAVVAAGLTLLAGFAIVHAARPVVVATLEQGEDFPGGAATTLGSTDHRDAFSRFSNGIGLAGQSRFKIGNAVFRKLWVSSPASTKSSDGLGPLYNARGCQNCHLKDGRGRPPADGEPAVSMFLRLSVPPRTDAEFAALSEGRTSVIPEPTYGSQLQNFSVQGHAPEGQMTIQYADHPVTLADGTIVTLRQPTYAVTDAAYGPLAPDVMLSPRVAPQMIGLGLLEAIPEAAIRASADPDDRNGDGISGRTNDVWSHEAGRLALGRFGWKAGNPTIRQQSAEAFSGDMGLSTSIFPRAWGDCSNNQPVCRDAPHGNSPAPADPEVSDQLLDLVTFYAQNLAVPRRRGGDTPASLRGKVLFETSGCASCHTPSHKTGELPGQPHLSHQTIWPYTDLLLHDMGDDLADNRPEGRASGREWRTPPLWGIGLTQTVSGHTFFLHDGRARSIEEAILWHGGEAQAARDAYTALPKADREALIAFVNAL
ncbi:MAG: di-heme oxidoredictase family protein [Hyphomicrobiaceae bacterium]|nr:di-heme oxidoredictase family protein [Hyphomicrobiaceae bacterium]